MMEFVKDVEAFAMEIGSDLTALWDEFKAFVRNKPVEVATVAAEAPTMATEPVTSVVEPVAEAAPPVVS